MKTARTKCLLFFAVCLLLSAIAVACDYHDPSQSKICPICFMGSSLSSAVGQASFVPQIYFHPLSFILVERTEPLWSAVFTSGVPYRGLLSAKVPSSHTCSSPEFETSDSVTRCVTGGRKTGTRARWSANKEVARMLEVITPNEHGEWKWFGNQK